MMKTANLGDSDDATEFRRLNGSSVRGVFPERQVTAKARHGCDGGLGRFTMYLATVA